MPSVIFEPPHGQNWTDPDPSPLQKLFVNPPEDYWLTGSGSALVRWTREPKAQLIIGYNEDYGFYLQFVPDHGEPSLSLHDRSQLDTVAEACDDWEASVGLFIPAERAWLAVEDFCRTGAPSPRIEWIAPADEIPDGGNW